MVNLGETDLSIIKHLIRANLEKSREAATYLTELGHFLGIDSSDADRWQFAAFKTFDVSF